MRIVDASSARIWGLERNQRLVGAEANQTADLYLGASRSIANRYSTTTPSATGYYLEGRRGLDQLQQSFVNIREAAYGTGLTLKNARFTDEQIERIIEQMNLTAR